MKQKNIYYGVFLRDTEDLVDEGTLDGNPASYAIPMTGYNKAVLEEEIRKRHNNDIWEVRPLPGQ